MTTRSNQTIAPSHAYQTAISLHQQGRLGEAERLYRVVLEAEPGHAGALHHLGVACAQRGQLDDAIRLIRRALEEEPRSAEAHNDLGVALEAANLQTEAIAPYERALALRSDYAEASFNLGNVLRTLGRHEEAIARFERALALRPNHAEAQNNLGTSLRALDRHPEAIDCFERALEAKPGFAEAHNNLGSVLQALARHPEAMSQFERALAIKPGYVEALYNLGNSHYALETFAKAIECYERAIALKPRDAKAHNNLGNSLAALGRRDEAIPRFKAAIALEPTYVEAYYNLGRVFESLGRPLEALAQYEKAIALDPGHAGALYNLGNTLSVLNRHSEAIANYQKALAHKPEFPEAHWNESLARLALGDFKAGWRKYEWRWHQKVRPHFSRPLWLGEEDLAGKTILLHAEQGFGDTLQFCRYAPLVRNLGADVAFEVQPELVDLLRDSLAGPHLSVLARGGDSLPAFDFQCPLMSLPLAFGTTVDTVPDAVPYLRADATRHARWAAWLDSAAPPGPRVGLVWAGNANHPRLSARRSVSLAMIRPFLEIENIAFVSLQKGEAAAQTASAGLRILDPSAQLHSFADTAALVANLDLVVSVDTSVAHLAGGLAKPVWLLSFGCWRWLCGREDSPWYPTVRLFRQPTPGAWQPVIERVAVDLRRLAAGERAILDPPRSQQIQPPTSLDAVH